MSKKHVSALGLLVLLAVGGCPTMIGDALGGRVGGGSQLDGSWWLDYTNAPNETLLTFTNGKVTSELAGGFQPVDVTWSTPATVVGSRVRFSYGSRQTVWTATGLMTAVGSLSFDGTFQPGGTIEGTMTMTGTLNGVPTMNTVEFTMRRQ